MKKTFLTIVAIFMMGVAWAQSPVVKFAAGGLKAVEGIKNMEATTRQVNTIAASKISKQAITPLAPAVSKDALLNVSLQKGNLSARAFPSISASMQNQVVTYRKEKNSERRGNGYITMYNLMVTNHSDKDLYVFGSVRIIGNPEQRERHFAGSVSAHSTKCLLTTVDNDFKDVTIKWQDDM